MSRITICSFFLCSFLFLFPSLLKVNISHPTFPYLYLHGDPCLSGRVCEHIFVPLGEKLDRLCGEESTGGPGDCQRREFRGYQKEVLHVPRRYVWRLTAPTTLAPPTRCLPQPPAFPALLLMSHLSVIPNKALRLVPDLDDISDCVDFIICLGGDGTLLYASSLFQASHRGRCRLVLIFTYPPLKNQKPNVTF